MSVTVVMNPGWRGDLDAIVHDRVLLPVGGAITDDMRRGCPVDTGALLASIRFSNDSMTLVSVHVGTDHWADVEYGTNPHTIVPRTKKALFWPGARHPVRKVNHPGTPAQPFIRPAVYQARAL